jgi:hypothetical protein
VGSEDLQDFFADVKKKYRNLAIISYSGREVIDWTVSGREGGEIRLEEVRAQRTDDWRPTDLDVQFFNKSTDSMASRMPSAGMSVGR